MSEEVRHNGALAGPGEDGAQVEKEEAPTGTLFFMMIFLLIMVGLWATVYLMLLDR